MKSQIITGDCLEVLKGLPDSSVHCCVTSPPYWGLRDYAMSGQLGQEPAIGEYVERMVEVFAEVRRVLRKDGTLWLNLGDTYASAWACPRRNVIGNGSPVERSKRIGRGSGRWGGGNASDPNLKEKDLCGIPWRVAFALQSDGWYLRQDIIWSKPNPMPESVTDRCTKSHEYIFLMSKSARYYYDAAAIAERCLNPEDDARRIAGVENGHKSIPSTEKNGLRKRNDKFGGNKYEGQKHSEQSTFTGSETRNRRSVWNVTTSPFPEAHFATFPPDLIEPCIKAGCPEGGTVLDPFSGAGTTGLVASRLGRNYIGIELNPEYVSMSQKRIENDCPMFNEVVADIRAGIES